MKNIILIFTLFFSLSAFGAEAKGSSTGLEGIAKDGIKISIIDYRDSILDYGDRKKEMENQVGLELRLAEIKVNKDASNHIVVNAQPVLPKNGKAYLYTVSVSARRRMTYQANGKQYWFIATVWDKTGINSPEKLRETINEHMDKFLLDYLKANPKKP